MFTLAAFYESQTNGVTYDALASVADQALTQAPSSGGYILPSNHKVIGGHVMGVNLSAARINAPSLRSFILPELYPTAAAAAVVTRQPFVDLSQQGVTILRNEAFYVETSRGGTDAQPVSAGLWLQERFIQPPAGPIFTAVATFSSTLIAGAWTTGVLTFNQTLPAGEYAVVGMDTIVGDAVFSRLIFPGQSYTRPGNVVELAYGSFIQPAYFRNGRMGLWGKFISTAIPQIEVFGLVAGAESGTAYIDLVKLN